MKQCMRNKNGITLITVIITIIILIILAGVSVNALIGEDGIIKEAKQAKGNYELAQEEEKENLNLLYEQMVTALESTESDSENEDSEESEVGTATAGQILEGYTVYQDGQLVEGSMPDRGAVIKELAAGESYTIPEGYHNGNGVITVSESSNVTVEPTIYAVGASQLTHGVRFDLSSIENYETLELYKNIFPVIGAAYASHAGATQGWTFTYTASTGILTVLRNDTSTTIAKPSGGTCYVVVY